MLGQWAAWKMCVLLLVGRLQGEEKGGQRHWLGVGLARLGGRVMGKQPADVDEDMIC